jgi:hypothetical protein
MGIGILYMLGTIVPFFNGSLIHMPLPNEVENRCRLIRIDVSQKLMSTGMNNGVQFMNNVTSLTREVICRHKLTSIEMYLNYTENYTSVSMEWIRNQMSQLYVKYKDDWSQWDYTGCDLSRNDVDEFSMSLTVIPNPGFYYIWRFLIGPLCFTLLGIPICILIWITLRWFTKPPQRTTVLDISSRHGETKGSGEMETEGLSSMSADSLSEENEIPRDDGDNENNDGGYDELLEISQHAREHYYYHIAPILTKCGLIK